MTTIRTTKSSLHIHNKSMQAAFLSDCDEGSTCTKSCLAVPRQCVKQLRQCRHWFHGKPNKLNNGPELAEMDQYDSVTPVKSTHFAPPTPCTSSSTSGSSSGSNHKAIKITMNNSTDNYETMKDNCYTPTSQLFRNKCGAIPVDSDSIKEVTEKDNFAQPSLPTLLTTPSGTNNGLARDGGSTIHHPCPKTLFLQIDSSHSSLNVPSILIPRRYELVNVDSSDVESIQTMDSMSTVTMDPAIRNACGSLASDPSETSLSLSTSSYQRQHQHQKVTSLLIRGTSYAFDHTIYTTDSSIWYSGGGGYNQQQKSKKSMRKKKTIVADNTIATSTTANNTKSTNLPPLPPKKRKNKVGLKRIVNTTSAYEQEPSVSPIAPRLLVEI